MRIGISFHFKLKSRSGFAGVLYGLKNIATCKDTYFLFWDMHVDHCNYLTDALKTTVAMNALSVFKPIVDD